MQTTATAPAAARPFPDLVFLNPFADGAEWDAAWSRLTHLDWLLRGGTDAAAGSRTSTNPESGETWQLMCSFAKDAAWWHEFRHRDHPTTGKRHVLHVPASDGWRPRADAA